MSPPDTVKVGVAAYIQHEGHLLMLHRKGGNGANTYSVPGGWVEPGEYHSRTAVREVKEETGLDVMPVSFMGAPIFNYDDEQRLWICTLFVNCRFVSGVPDNMEPDKASWVGWKPIIDIKNGVVTPLFAPLHDFYRFRMDQL